MVSVHQPYEGIVDEIARTFFPCSRYVHEVESQLFHGKRQPTTLDAECWLEDTVGRYCRLARRHGVGAAISNHRLVEATFASLPHAVETELRQKYTKFHTLDQLFREAREVEAELLRAHGKIPEPLGAFPVVDRSMEDGEIRPSDASKATERPRFRCGCCGSANHPKKDCPKKHYRCHNCLEIGHLSNVCTATVEKDSQERVRTVFKSKPSRNEFVTKKDATQKDRVIGATDVLTAVRKVAEERARRDKERRVKKKEESGWVRQKKLIEHPAAVVQAAEEVDSASDDDGERFVSAVERELGLYYVGVGNLKAKAVLGGRPYEVVIDTGAARSMCSTAVAADIGLTLLPERRSFRGIGVTTGQRAAGVECILQGITVVVEFWVVEASRFPIIIGRLDLVRMGVLIDPETGVLQLKQESVALPAEDDSDDELPESQPNVVSTIDERKSDGELLGEYRTLFMGMTGHLEEEVRERLWNLLVKFQQCWLRPRTGRALGHAVEFEVVGKPVKMRMRPLAPELRKELDTHIDNMLEMGVIRPSKSPWASTPVFVKKKTGEWRLCLDYRRLNLQMIADAYPLPLIWENLQLAAGHKFFICVDCSWGFWNIPLEEGSKQYTAFISHRGMFEYNVLPFGIRNSPAAMQRAMDSIFGDLLHKGVLVYIDDIVMYADSLDEVFMLFEEVLTRCIEFGLFLKLKKSEFLKPVVKLLGHYVGADGIRPSTEKIKAIRESVAPRNRKELRSFLGLASYVRRFVPNFASIAEPLTRLTSPRARWEWNEEQVAAFSNLQEAVCEHVLLSCPRNNDGFVIVTDASDVGVGAALLQYVDGDLEVLEFASKKLNSAQRKWSTTEREAFGIRWAVAKFEDYVKAGKIFILTDHDALRWMASASAGKVLRWGLYLQQFDLRIAHIAGEDNVIADWLSRRGHGEDDLADEEIELMSVPVFTVESSCVAEQHLVPALPSHEQFVRALEEVSSDDLRLFVKGKDGLYHAPRTGALFVPLKLREGLMYWFHLSRYGAHAGVNRMLRRMRPLLNWPGMAQDVRRYVAACLACQRLQSRPPRTVHGYLSKPLPFQLVSVDFVGPLQLDAYLEKRYFLVIIDHATRFLMADFVWEATAAEAVRLLKTRWVAVFGSPAAILSDRGSTFVSGEFQDYVLEELQAYHVFTSPYYPQGNAINESSHRVLKKALTLSTRLGYYALEDCLRDAVLVHNACPHPGIGCSPCFALLGMEMPFPGWQEFSRVPEQEARLDALYEFRQRSLVRCALLERSVREDPDDRFSPGDWVLFWLANYERSKEGIPKIGFSDTNWSLPAKVASVKDNVLIVHPLGRPQSERQVPKTLARRLATDIPRTLVDVNLREIQMSQPRRKPLGVAPGDGSPVRSWSGLLEQAGGDGRDVDVKKRRRPTRIVPGSEPVHAASPTDVEEDDV